MTYDITLTFRVGDIDKAKDARDFANQLAEHVLETFNDNQTIASEVWFKTKRVTT